MKQFWLALGLLLTMLVSTLGNALYLDGLTSSITNQLEAAQKMAQRDAWEQAGAITQECFARWEDRRAYLHIVSCHADTDEILRSFRAVTQYIKLEEMDQYAAENRELITKIELLAEKEQPDWLNVL